MQRPVHCAQCGALNKIEGVKGGIKSVTDRNTLRSKYEFECSSCEQSFFVRYDGKHWPENPLFDIDATIRAHQLDYEYTIPIEHNHDIEFRYDFIVREGEPVDILFMSKEEYYRLKRGHRFRVFPEYSKRGVVDVRDSGTLPEGEHIMFIGNPKKEGKMTFSCEMTAESG